MKSHDSGHIQHTRGPQHMPHISQYSHAYKTECTVQRAMYRASSVCRFVRGNEDPAKMTHTIMALIKRVLAVKCIFTSHGYTLYHYTDHPTYTCTRSGRCKCTTQRDRGSNAHETCARAEHACSTGGGRHPRVRGRASSSRQLERQPRDKPPVDREVRVYRVAHADFVRGNKDPAKMTHAK